ncbi:MAG: PP2C family protein-serine/threonine phosphatase [Bacteroidales bacterium]
MLPKEDQFRNVFSEYFILFKPQSIVSGDFYWIHTNEHKIYLTAADCTGHGVPGAFMSMLGISSMNEIMNNHHNPKTAADILNQLRNMVKHSLHQTGKKDLAKDGIDMAFCAIDQKKMEMDFAGAFNPLYLFRNGNFEKYEADRMPVGIYHTEKESFTNHRISLRKGDVIYLFSDGYVDQFGGSKNKKFKPKNFIELLSRIHHKPMEEQHEILNQTFMQWKGDNFQVDDVLVFGIRI